jgi:hypothetical protein
MCLSWRATSRYWQRSWSTTFIHVRLWTNQITARVTHEAPKFVASKFVMLQAHTERVTGRCAWPNRTATPGYFTFMAGLKSMHLEGYSSTSIIPGWLMAISCNLTNLVSFELCDLPTCSNLLPLGQLPHLDKLSLWKLPAIKRIDREFCGGNGAFRRLLSF